MLEFVHNHKIADNAFTINENDIKSLATRIAKIVSGPDGPSSRAIFQNPENTSNPITLETLFNPKRSKDEPKSRLKEKGR